ncbi:hypothetical protein G3O08_11630 [Cryomorpha ignava]|uniref:LamG-like jellyroll fold domain-containing protein n=1 Tax=Cryomorpha ignava TaxID=101383 RepID=A0A7K3WTE6_9FLAO|nr:LamG-like jellyroll fold domain-containing protein [Cryomorpha ignava]NEN24152.1 hypothetical protein [Cryomorpha ignava]
MATYKANIDTVAESIVYTVGERHIYGSDRVGMYNYPDTVYPIPAASTASFQPVWRGYRKYELKNHLGNVTTVVNANKIPLDDDDNGIIDGFDAIIEGAYDYSPFGVTRKTFEPSYTAGTNGEANPLAPDFRWCFDGDGIEANGSGHDATLYSTTLIDDRNSETGKALKTAGNANSYIEIADHADFDFGSTDFTVGIWVKKLVNNSSWNHTIAAGKWHSGQQAGNNEWYLAISNGGSGSNPPQFAIEIGTTKYTAAGSPLATGSWYHLVGVREGNNIKLYIDGTLIDTEFVGTGAINNNPAREILIGKMDNGKYLEAGFDEFVVYHRALDATEVDELYGMGCGDFEGEMASGGYRYGFNGMEKDDEIKGEGNSYTTPFRELDPRLGRWLTIDPVVKYWESPYASFANNPIYFIDPSGLDPGDPVKPGDALGSAGSTAPNGGERGGDGSIAGGEAVCLGCGATGEDVYGLPEETSYNITSGPNNVPDNAFVLPPVTIPVPTPRVIPVQPSPTPILSPYARGVGLIALWSLFGTADTNPYSPGNKEFIVFPDEVKGVAKEDMATLRVQFQTGESNIASQSANNFASVGVTVLQADVALHSVYSQALSKHKKLVMSPQFAAAFQKMAARVANAPPYGIVPGHTQMNLSHEFYYKGILYRIEVEALRGHSLRQ